MRSTSPRSPRVESVSRPCDKPVRDTTQIARQKQEQQRVEEEEIIRERTEELIMQGQFPKVNPDREDPQLSSGLASPREPLTPDGTKKLWSIESPKNNSACTSLSGAHGVGGEDKVADQLLNSSNPASPRSPRSPRSLREDAEKRGAAVAKPKAKKNCAIVKAKETARRGSSTL